jgi:membrane dipeptidase
VNFHARFLTGGLEASLSDVVRHVRHFVRVVGVEHVAIGSDFEGGIRPPKELADVRGFPVLARALEDGGLSRADVSKIFHGNALRVLCGTRPPLEKP